MSINLVSFSSEHLPVVASFSEALWLRPRQKNFYQWRYLDCPNQKGLLALREGKCVGMVWFFVRPYRMGPRCIKGLEVLDWATLPEVRSTGFGIRLLQKMMKEPMPILNVGGSEDTRRILPGLGWISWGEVAQFFLPLTGTLVGHSLKNKLGIPAGLTQAVFNTTGRYWFRPRRKLSPDNGRVEAVRILGSDLLELYACEKDDRALPLPDVSHLQWLVNAPPGMGQYLPLYFKVGGKLSGWSFTRVSETPQGRIAQLIELYVPPGKEPLLNWMLSETLAALAPFQPDGVYAGASLPAIQQVLREHRFLRRPSFPVHYWPADTAPPRFPLICGNNTSDAGLLPYPSV